MTISDFLWWLRDHGQIDFGNFAVGMGTALLAIASFLSMRHGRKQRVAEFRKEWLESLRLRLAEFHSLCFSLLSLKKLGALDERNKELQVEWRSELTKLKNVHSFIDMMLNQNEPAHRDLYDLMGRMVAQLLEDEDTEPIAHDQFNNAAHDVLKIEWDRISRSV